MLQCRCVLTPHDPSRTAYRTCTPQVPAAIWSFLELFGEWGGTWTLLLNLTALVVLLNYQMALCAQKGHRGLSELSQPKQKRSMSLQPEDQGQGDLEMQA